MNSILDNNPKDLYKAIRKAKTESTPTLHFLDVNGTKFVGSEVPDGFYFALSELKSNDHSSNPSFPSIENLHNNILKLTLSGKPIPPVSLHTSSEILKSLKSMFVT